MQKKFLVIFSIFLSVLFFLVGFFSNSLFKTNKNSSDQDTFKAGWDAAKKRLQETNLCGYPILNQEIKTVSGIITKIENNKIYIKANPLEPLSEPELDNRIILLNKDTKLFRINLVENNKEADENFGNYPEEKNYSKTISKKSEINLSDLKIGEFVSADSQSDIKDSKIINAQEIIIQ